MGRVTITLDGDEARAVRSLQRLISKEKELARAATDAGQSSKQASEEVSQGARGAGSAMDEAGKKRDKAFGAQARDQLKGMASGFIGVSAAIGLVIEGLREVNQLREEAAAKQRASELGIASLAQLAGGDSEKLRSLRDAARQTFLEGGARSLDEAAGVVFQLESAGALGNRELFSQLFGVVDDTAGLARSATTIQTAIGEDETGSIRDIVSKGFAASSFSPATVPELLEGAAKSGAGARALGISDEEVLAGTALLAKSSGSAQQGGTQLASLLKAFTKRGGFQGLSLQESLSELQGRKLSDPDLIEFLGRQEAFTAFSTLTRPDVSETFGTALEDIRQAQDTDRVGTVLANVGDTLPEVAASRLSRQAEARKELAAGPIGTKRLVADAIFDRQQAELLNRDAEFEAGIREFQRSSSIPGFRISDDDLVNPHLPFLQGPGAGPTGEEQRVLDNLNRDQQRLIDLQQQTIDAQRPTALASPDEDR